MKTFTKILLVGGLIVGAVFIAKKVKKQKANSAGKTVIGNNTANPTAKNKRVVIYSTGLIR